ncbi:hypothetical protein JOM56_012430 [Amanita muscaria]
MPFIHSLLDMIDISLQNNDIGEQYIASNKGHPYIERTLCRFRKLLLEADVDYDVKYRESKAILQAHPQAGKWLLTKNSYSTWRAGKTGLFWLTGAPGTGKTFLSSVVIDDHKNDPGAIVLSFTCDYRNRKTCNRTNIYASLLYQLLSSIACTSNASTLARLEPYQNAQSKNELPLGDLILVISREINQRVVTVIDGIENCDDIQDIALDLVFIAEHIPVFVSSRDHPDIRDVLEWSEKVTIKQDDVIEDVRRFVKKEVKYIRVRDPDFQASIVDKLITGAQGNFSWTASHIHQIRQFELDNDIRKSLNKPPRQISKICIRSLRRIDAMPHSELLRLAIRLVVCAVQPITLRALTQAATMPQMGAAWCSDSLHRSSNPRWIVDDCANLLKCVPATDRSQYEHYWAGNRVDGQTIEINIDGDDEIVIPFHPSVRDFLGSSPIILPNSLVKYALHPLKDAHATLARMCQNHLNLALRLQKTADPRHAFTNYALSACPLHLRATGRDAVDSEELFTLWNRVNVDFWEPILKYYLDNFRIININGRGPRGRTALHCAVQGGSPILVASLLEKGAKIDLVDDCGDTPLLVAMKMTLFSVPLIVHLLDHGADVNARDRRGFTPNFLATRRGHESLMTLVRTATFP